MRLAYHCQVISDFRFERRWYNLRTVNGQVSTLRIYCILTLLRVEWCRIHHSMIPCAIFTRDMNSFSHQSPTNINLCSVMSTTIKSCTQYGSRNAWGAVRLFEARKLPSQRLSHQVWHDGVRDSRYRSWWNGRVGRWSLVVEFPDMNIHHLYSLNCSVHQQTWYHCDCDIVPPVKPTICQTASIG